MKNKTKKHRFKWKERQYRFALIALAVTLAFILFLTNHPEGIKFVELAVQILGSLL